MIASFHFAARPGAGTNDSPQGGYTGSPAENLPIQKKRFFAGAENLSASSADQEAAHLSSKATLDGRRYGTVVSGNFMMKHAAPDSNNAGEPKIARHRERICPFH